MSKIKLLYSYLYIKNTKNLQIKKNKIYDINNEFVCGLSNIPSNNGIKIILERNLIKNKYSKKIVNTHYEKNNIKVYLEFDITNNINKNKDCLIKIFKNNYFNFLNLNKNLFDSLCINKNYNKELFKNYEFSIINQYIIQLYNLHIDLSKNSIKKIENNKYKNITFNFILNFNILYSDYLLGTIKILNKYNFNNVLVICANNYIKLLWENNFSKSNYEILTIFELKNININNNYNNIIFCDLDNKILKKILQTYFSKNKVKNYLYIYTNYQEETILNFIIKFYSIINITIKNKIKEIYDITIQTLYNYSKCIIFHNFYDLLIHSSSIKKLINNEKINKILKNITFNIKKDYHEAKNKINCSICLENIEENEFIYLNCNHKFCRNCILYLKKYKFNCSICRAEITHLKKDVCEKSLFCNNKWYYIGNIFRTIIEIIKKSNYKSVIFLENSEYYNLLDNILCYYVPNKFKIIIDYKSIYNSLDTILDKNINKNLDKNINKNLNKNIDIDKNTIIDKNLDKNLDKNIDKNIFYLKNDSKLIKHYNYLYLILNNFYTSINLFEFTINFK